MQQIAQLWMNSLFFTPRNEGKQSVEGGAHGGGLWADDLGF